jgi:hypothetical protein
MKDNEQNGSATTNDVALTIQLPKEYRDMLEILSRETKIDSLKNTVKHCIIVASKLWEKDLNSKKLYLSFIANSIIVEQNN